MFIFNLIKKLLCTHDFVLLAKYNADSEKGVGYNLVTRYIMYCPKCRHEVEMLEHEYNKTIARQDIDSNFK